MNLRKWSSNNKALLSLTQSCIQLHGFSDASASAYAAVDYVHTVSPQGEVIIQIIAFKTKAEPTKKQSIPRLEMMADLLLSKLELGNIKICVPVLVTNNIS